jgi:hypothetical protein
VAGDVDAVGGRLDVVEGQPARAREVEAQRQTEASAGMSASRVTRCQATPLLIGWLHGGGAAPGGREDDRGPPKIFPLQAVTFSTFPRNAEASESTVPRRGPSHEAVRPNHHRPCLGGPPPDAERRDSLTCTARSCRHQSREKKPFTKSTPPS